MSKKRAVNPYPPKPAVAVPARAPLHPSALVARALLRWLEQGDVPPSKVLLHGLFYSRNPENDGLPLETLRPNLKHSEDDGKSILKILEALARPNTVKEKVLADWLKASWVPKKSVRTVAAPKVAAPKATPPKAQTPPRATPVIIKKQRKIPGA